MRNFSLDPPKNEHIRKPPGTPGLKLAAWRHKTAYLSDFIRSSGTSRQDDKAWFLSTSFRVTFPAWIRRAAK
jgi:hypothetical protein